MHPRAPWRDQERPTISDTALPAGRRLTKTRLRHTLGDVNSIFQAEGIGPSAAWNAFLAGGAHRSAQLRSAEGVPA
jgi:hypothetical protein